MTSSLRAAIVIGALGGVVLGPQSQGKEVDFGQRLARPTHRVTHGTKRSAIVTCNAAQMSGNLMSAYVRWLVSLRRPRRARRCFKPQILIIHGNTE